MQRIYATIPDKFLNERTFETKINNIDISFKFHKMEFSKDQCPKVSVSLFLLVINDITNIQNYSE